MTAFGTVATAVDAMKRGAADYLTKPIDLDELELVLARTLERRALESENRELRQALATRHRLQGLETSNARMAAGHQHRRARGGEPRDGAHPGRERHGQGTAGTRHPPTRARARRGPSSP
jgi:YesN/AraC family two-component response regulator